MKKRELGEIHRLYKKAKRRQELDRLYKKAKEREKQRAEKLKEKEVKSKDVLRSDDEAHVEKIGRERVEENGQEDNENQQRRMETANIYTIQQDGDGIDEESNEKEERDFERFIMGENKEIIDEIGEEESNELKNIHKKVFRYGESFEFGVLGIYHLCKSFPKRNKVDKPFFSAKELNFVLAKHKQFFNIIRGDLVEKKFIKYYGSITRKEKSNRKAFTITEEGQIFAENLIKTKLENYSDSYNELIKILEGRYLDFNKELFKSKDNGYIIRSKREIEMEIDELCQNSNLKRLTPYISDHSDIQILCKSCQRKFSISYRTIKNRNENKLFCPDCYPKLQVGIYLSEKLRYDISEIIFRILNGINLNEMSSDELRKFRNKINSDTYNKLKNSIEERDKEYQKLFKRYIYSISKFLIIVRKLDSLDQYVPLQEVALKCHDKSIVSKSKWSDVCREIIHFLRKRYDFNVRTKGYYDLSLSERISIKIFKNMYKVIMGDNGKGRNIIYLDKDLKTKIPITYNGKCQGDGINECPFGIDYKFLPMLSFDHRIEKYQKNIKHKNFEYVTPTKLLKGKFNEILKNLRSQLGGMDLRCRNCHALNHHNLYQFPPINNYLKSVHKTYIDKYPSRIANDIDNLARQFFKDNNLKQKITKRRSKSKILGEIRLGIRRHIRKKYVIEFLFGENYQCPICKKTNVNEHLTCFEAHHTNEVLFNERNEKDSFSRLFYKKIDWLIKNIILQECIFICRNCHTMITTKNYEDHALNILKNKEDACAVEEYYIELNKTEREFRNLILDKKEKLKKKELNIPNPFSQIFYRGEGIDMILVCIYYICDVFSKKLNKKYFEAEELNFIQDKGERYFTWYKDPLMRSKYIELLERVGLGGTERCQITDVGRKKAKNILNNKGKEFPNKLKDLVNFWEERFDTYHRMDSFYKKERHL